MAAYASLTYLLLSLDNIHIQNLSDCLDADQLDSLRVKVSFLLHTLQNCSTKASSNYQALERKIRDVAFRAEDLVGSATYQSLLYKTPGILPWIFSTVLLLFSTFILIGFIFLSLLSFGISRLLRLPFLFILPFLLLPISLFILSIFMIFVCIISKLDSLSALPLFIKKRLVDLLVRDGTKDRQVLNEIFEEIELIEEEATSMIERGGNLPFAAASSSSTYSCINEICKDRDTVVGMDSDLNIIKTRLRYGSDRLQIVPVVGMGGIGKTTLATTVYNDAYIRHQFDVCAWATVSQDYCFRRIVLDLLNSANLLTVQGESSDGELACNLYQSFYGRRYFIVLDDVWDVETWNDVRRFLPHENNGSRVLLTTRSSAVAQCANSCGPQHQMHFLHEHDSQSLLHGRVFGDEDCPDDLIVVRDEIAKSCKGLPLTLVVVSGLLSKIERTQRSWRNFADSLSLVGNIVDDDECMEILALSYNCLPHHLKPCFLYMGMFPEDYVFPVTKLIWLWVGEGFLRPNNSKSPEELAEEYLEELVERNLILACNWSSQGRIRRCKIHDVIRKLCLREAQKEKFLFAINCPNDVSRKDIEYHRRLSIHPEVLRVHPHIIQAKELTNSVAHSVTCIGNRLNSLQALRFGYRPLRVLDLLTLHFPKFPLDVTRLINLRYLGVSSSESLHPYISRLQNLQIIIHRDVLSHLIFLLPPEIWMIPNLRHVRIPPSRLPTAPNGSSHFSLQTLAEVVNLSFDNQCLDKIQCLKKLCLSYEVEQQSFKGWLEHKLENLSSLNHLEKLKLKVINFIPRSGFTYPQNLTFPQSLKKLTLSGCRFPWENLTIIGALPTLEVLKLRDSAYKGTKWEPVEGQFCQLKFLELQHLNLVTWKATEIHFPRLECLVVSSCHQLEEIPLSIGDILALHSIKLMNCHPAIVTSAKMIKEYQEHMMGSSDLKVRVFDSN